MLIFVRFRLNHSNMIGRHKEIALLKTLEHSTEAEFIAIYGRRRIGKTYLVREHFKNQPFFLDFTGTKKTKVQDQIKNFLVEVSRLKNNKNLPDVKSWKDALNLLGEIITTSTDKKKIIFFDELPWLASKNSGFLEALDYFWNSFLVKRKDIILIVCGSAAQWMIKNVVHNKAGLHNRMTRPPLAMAPFTLTEVKEYFLSKNIDLSHEQIVELYMVTGGVAYYLKLYERGDSAAQFINKNFFASDGNLRSEFDRLIVSLFDKPQMHLKVIHALADHPAGLNHSALVENTSLTSGGTLSKVLEELERAHFIRFNPQLNKKKKDGHYILSDEYILFYLTWIYPLGRSFKDATYWQKQVGKPKYNSWLGCAFESLCFRHVDKIIHALGISGLTTEVFGFRNDRAQIDLVIDRSDKTINLCEMKYTYAPYAMSDTEAEKIKNRKLELQNSLKRKKQIFVTLITPQAADKNKHYTKVVDNELNLDIFFS